MKPIEIVRKDTQATVGHACGQCGNMWTDKMFGGAVGAGLEQAERCCAPRLCEKCGEDIGRGWCKACSARESAEKEQRAFDAAEKVDLANYDGAYLCFEDIAIGHDGYVPTEDAEDVLDEYKGERPVYAWACAPEGVSWDLARNLEDYIADEHYGDAFEHVDDVKLQAAQKLVDEACAGVTSYHADYRRAVLLPPAKTIEASK